MHDYDADCLWDDIIGVMVPMSDLPLSDSLKQRLTAWRERWEEINDAAIRADDFDTEDLEHDREKRELWIKLREELGSDFEVGLAVPSPGGPDTRVHVIWEPGGDPELPIWHQRQERVSDEDDV